LQEVSSGANSARRPAIKQIALKRKMFIGWIEGLR